MRQYSNIISYLIAISRWAFLISGFMFLLAKMSVRDAPTMARWNFCVLLVFFLVVSSSWPLRCLRLRGNSLNRINLHSQWYRRFKITHVPVQYRPCYFTRIPLHQMSTFTFWIEESECLHGKQKQNTITVTSRNLRTDIFYKPKYEHTSDVASSERPRIVPDDRRRRAEIFQRFTFPSALTIVLPWPG